MIVMTFKFSRTNLLEPIPILIPKFYAVILECPLVDLYDRWDRREV